MDEETDPGLKADTEALQVCTAICFVQGGQIDLRSEFDHRIEFCFIKVKFEMKKASKLFSGLVKKSKQIYNDVKKEVNEQMAAKQGTTKRNEDDLDEDGFDSGEDDDLIEIGKHKGAAEGAKSVFEDLESLTGDQILREDRYAEEFNLLQSGKTNGPKTDVEIIMDAIQTSMKANSNSPDEESKVEEVIG